MLGGELYPGNEQLWPIAGEQRSISRSGKLANRVTEIQFVPGATVSRLNSSLKLGFPIVVPCPQNSNIRPPEI